MTIFSHHPSLISRIFLPCLLYMPFCCFLPNPALCFKPRHFNLSTVATHWSAAGATWYGSPNGARTTGGACGYGGTMSQAPFSSLITAVSPSLCQTGKERGACYQIKCTAHPSSGKPVRVVTTDLCPGGPCLSESAHFLSQRNCIWFHGKSRRRRQTS